MTAFNNHAKLMVSFSLETLYSQAPSCQATKTHIYLAAYELYDSSMSLLYK